MPTSKTDVPGTSWTYKKKRQKQDKTRQDRTRFDSKWYSTHYVVVFIPPNAPIHTKNTNERRFWRQQRQRRVSWSKTPENHPKRTLTNYLFHRKRSVRSYLHLFFFCRAQSWVGKMLNALCHTINWLPCRPYRTVRNKLLSDKENTTPRTKPSTSPHSYDSYHTRQQTRSRPKDTRKK